MWYVWMCWGTYLMMVLLKTMAARFSAIVFRPIKSAEHCGQNCTNLNNNTHTHIESISINHHQSASVNDNQKENQCILAYMIKISKSVYLYIKIFIEIFTEIEKLWIGQNCISNISPAVCCCWQITICILWIFYIFELWSAGTTRQQIIL